MLLLREARQDLDWREKTYFLSLVDLRFIEREIRPGF